MILPGDRVLDYKDEIINHLCELIKIKSVKDKAAPGKPYGEGAYAALLYMLDLASSLGFKTKNIDGHAGYAEYGQGEKIAAVLVHLDVVPEGEGWTYPPYGGTIADGKIYGRGTADNKGPAVVALYSLKVLKDMGLIPDKRIRVIFGTDEESGMKDMEYYFTKEPLPDIAFSPDTAYPIYNREKGIIHFDLSSEIPADDPEVIINGGTAANVVPESCQAVFPLSALAPGAVYNAKSEALSSTFTKTVVTSNDESLIVKTTGFSAHASSPSTGLNAISYLLGFLFRVKLLSEKKGLLYYLNNTIGIEFNGKSLGIDMRDPESGELTLNLGMLRYSEYGAKATVDIRYPVTADGSTILSRITQAASKYGVKISNIHDSPPLFVKPDHPLIAILSEAYEKITGQKAGLMSMGGGTYARTLKNRGVAFGSAEGANYHKADEYVLIDKLLLHARICTQAMYEMAVAKLP